MEVIIFKAFDRLEKDYNKLKEIMNQDPAKHASSMLYYHIRRLRENDFLKHYYFQQGVIDLNEKEILDEKSKDIRSEINKLLSDRIKWMAERIEETIQSRKENGTYKNEFTTEIILANAFNDIFNIEEMKF